MTSRRHNDVFSQTEYIIVWLRDVVEQLDRFWDSVEQ